jgi:hypothetical protein
MKSKFREAMEQFKGQLIEVTATIQTINPRKIGGHYLLIKDVIHKDIDVADHVWITAPAGFKFRSGDVVKFNAKVFGYYDKQKSLKNYNLMFIRNFQKTGNVLRRDFVNYKKQK